MIFLFVGMLLAWLGNNSKCLSLNTAILGVLIPGKCNTDEIESPDVKAQGRKEAKLTREGESFCCLVCLEEVLHWNTSNNCDDDESILIFVKVIVTAGSIDVALGYPRRHWSTLRNLTTHFCAPPAILTDMKILSVV